MQCDTLPIAKGTTGSVWQVYQVTLSIMCVHKQETYGLIIKRLDGISHIFPYTHMLRQRKWVQRDRKKRAMNIVNSDSTAEKERNCVAERI